ncbi:acetyl-hydrolase [Trichodelitschia bisporula]|uniref:Acetyl-hydrolase n=1 Tax=Trichodelitschia bisporula TaxID=703511 RepID=A0A6G1HR76_9PEZI|nr:acetyl-hydrolase [Trichodelitschia bisporula]
MDISAADLVRLLLPKLPSITKSILLHALRLSDTSAKWDLRTALTMAILRCLVGTDTPHPMGKQQHNSIRDPGVKGRLWVSRLALPAPPEDDARATLFAAIEAMKLDGIETYTQPAILPVEAEWTGYRPNVAKDAPEPSISEAEKYESLLKDASGPTVILYFHGGAYFLMDPATHRNATARLAQLTKGRVLSVRYRLSPQNPFPAALLDGLVAYLSLLHPPPGAPHAAVKPENIVFAGDSAGGNLATALLQFLLQAQRANGGHPPPISFHGARIPLALPAGVSLNSPWMDVTRCLSSLVSNAKWDYLPPPTALEALRYTPDDIWPTKPPRVDVFCDGAAMTHPLVSPLAALDWTGAPPVYIVSGEEMLADEAQVVAARMARQGVVVEWEQWEAMPHCFAMVFQGTEINRRVFDTWSDFCVRVTTGQEVKPHGVWVEAKTWERKEVDVKGLTAMPDDEVLRQMREKRDERIRVGEEYLKKLAEEGVGKVQADHAKKGQAKHEVHAKEEEAKANGKAGETAKL